VTVLHHRREELLGGLDDIDVSGKSRGKHYRVSDHAPLGGSRGSIVDVQGALEHLKKGFSLQGGRHNDRCWLGSPDADAGRSNVVKGIVGDGIGIRPVHRIEAHVVRGQQVGRKGVVSVDPNPNRQRLVLLDGIVGVDGPYLCVPWE